jgi:uncharacterized protein (TIGR00661 family)
MSEGQERQAAARPRRLVYAVHGYGRGHATRSMAMLAELQHRHEVLVLAGGDAYEAMAADFPVVRIPTLGFAYGKDTGQRSNAATFRLNFGAVLDAWWRGAVYQMVASVVREFSPDVIISDAEMWSNWVARDLNIPRINFDHMGVLAYCDAPLDAGDRFEAAVDAYVYRTLIGRADRILVSSFYPAPPREPHVRVVPTLARQAVREATPTDGAHLLVYLNKGHHQFDARMRQVLAGLNTPVKIYGTQRRGVEGPLSFLPPGNASFVQDLASCRAVLSTAGNQLVGEAMWLGKPMLVMPERCVEQRMNANALVQMGLGMRVEQRALKAEHLQQFLARRDEFAARMRMHSRDGLAESLQAMEQFIEELAPGNVTQLRAAATHAHAARAKLTPTRAALP